MFLELALIDYFGLMFIILANPDAIYCPVQALIFWFQGELSLQVLYQCDLVHSIKLCLISWLRLSFSPLVLTEADRDGPHIFVEILQYAI